MQFEIEGKEYGLKYNIKRLELIEATVGVPTMAHLVNNKGFLSLQHLKSYVGMALKEVGEDTFVPSRKGQEYAEALILSEGYETINAAVLEQMMEDCPFLFPNG